MDLWRTSSFVLYYILAIYMYQQSVQQQNKLKFLQHLNYKQSSAKAGNMIRNQSALQFTHTTFHCQAVLQITMKIYSLELKRHFYTINTILHENGLICCSVNYSTHITLVQIRAFVHCPITVALSGSFYNVKYTVCCVLCLYKWIGKRVKRRKDYNSESATANGLQPFLHRFNLTFKICKKNDRSVTAFLLFNILRREKSNIQFITLYEAV